MDKGAWRATVPEVTRAGHDLATKPTNQCAHVNATFSVCPSLFFPGYVHKPILYLRAFLEAAKATCSEWRCIWKEPPGTVLNIPTLRAWLYSTGVSSHFCTVHQCSFHWLFPISIYMCLVFSSLKETPLLTAHSSPSASSMLLPFSVLKGSSIPVDSTSSPSYYLENGHKNTTYQNTVIQPRSSLEINSSPSTCWLI